MVVPPIFLILWYPLSKVFVSSAESRLFFSILAIYNNNSDCGSHLYEFRIRKLENMQLIVKLGDVMGAEQKDYRGIIQPLWFLFVRFLWTLTKDPRVF